MKRNTLLTIALVALMLTAGCAGWGEDGVHDPDAESEDNADEQEQEQQENQDDTGDDSSDSSDGTESDDGSESADSSDTPESNGSGESDKSGDSNDTTDSTESNESDESNDTTESTESTDTNSDTVDDNTDESDDSGPSEASDDNNGDSGADETDGSQDEDSASDEDSEPAGDSGDSDSNESDTDEGDSNENDSDEDTADEPEEDPEVHTLTVWAGEARPVTDVDVTLERHSDGATTTREVDDNGVVEFRVVDGDYTVSGTDHEGETYTREVTIDGDDAEVTLPLDPPMADEPDGPEEDPEQDPEGEEDPEAEEPEDPDNSDMYTQTATVSVRNPSGTPLSGVTVEYGPAGGEPNAETSTNGNGKAIVQSRTSVPDDATMLDVWVNGEQQTAHATTSGDDTVEFVIESDGDGDEDQ